MSSVYNSLLLLHVSPRFVRNYYIRNYASDEGVEMDGARKEKDRTLMFCPLIWFFFFLRLNFFHENRINEIDLTAQLNVSNVNDYPTVDN